MIRLGDAFSSDPAAIARFIITRFVDGGDSPEAARPPCWSSAHSNRSRWPDHKSAVRVPQLLRCDDLFTVVLEHFQTDFTIR